MSYGIPRDRKLSPTTDEWCEDCEIETPAVWEIAGETDSFGTEWIPVCQAHYDEHLNAEVDWGACDVCGTTNGTYRTRDPSEGSHGPVYITCHKHAPSLD